MSIRYSSQRYRRESVAGWAELFQTELISLIAHCTSGVRGATPSDFPLANLTQEQLDRLPVRLDRVEAIYPLSPLQQE